MSRPIPDLLSDEAQARVDLPALRDAIVFGFAVGVPIETFQEIVERATMPLSSWDRAHFARDLFLEELVEKCLPVRINGRPVPTTKGYLLRALAEPPKDDRVRAFRKGILTELAANKAFRADLERVYVAIVRVRAELTGRQPARGLRRMEILRGVHDAFELLSKGFEGALSGLSRLREFGEAAVASDGFSRLRAVLDHDEHMGTVDVRVRVGNDGEVRRFQILAVRENTENPFHTSAIGRWIAKLRLFLRGYRMNGGEVVERMFDDVVTALERDISLLFQVAADIEVYLASLGFRDRAMAAGLDVCFADVIEQGGEGMNVERLFNPLLLTEKRSPVPCDLVVDEAGTVVVVTGPNSGGKTRLLQAIALTQMLGEAGFFVPARAARLPRVTGLFVSLLEDARHDQPEGQLGMELLRIRRLFEELEPGSLVLLDELCSGTNPSEGEEIARLVITLLPELGAQVFVTTHLLRFAERLESERPIKRLATLQVEIGPREAPTYRFIPGVAKTSLAHKTAARLGVTREELVALIAEKRALFQTSSQESEPSDPPESVPSVRPPTVH